MQIFVTDNVRHVSMQFNNLDLKEFEWKFVSMRRRWLPISSQKGKRELKAPTGGLSYNGSTSFLFNTSQSRHVYCLGLNRRPIMIIVSILTCNDHDIPLLFVNTCDTITKLSHTHLPTYTGNSENDELKVKMGR